jgi:hypothetical protein
MQLSVKNVNDKVFREFKAEAVREGASVGEALTFAMDFWIRNRKKKPKMSLLDLKPVNFGPGSERLSEQIEEVLYG